jgi:Flp pilus assembly protein CpaB
VGLERKIASQIVDATMTLNEQIGSIDLAIRSISDEQEKRQYAAALGNLLRVIREDILLKIFKDHPDLNLYNK